jgi:hypothetical protein
MDNLGVDGRIVFQLTKKREGVMGRLGIGLIWLRILTTVRDVCVAVMYCLFYKMQGTFWLVDAHLAPKDGLLSV